MGAIGKCCCGVESCCETPDICTGANNTKTQVTFEITDGLHPHEFTEDIRTYLDCLTEVIPFRNCQGGSILSSIDYPDQIRSVSIPEDLDSDCCLRIQMFPLGEESSSALVTDYRDWTQTVSVDTLTTTAFPGGSICDGESWDERLFIDADTQASVAIGARRIIDSVEITICPVTVPAEGETPETDYWRVSVCVRWRRLAKWAVSSETNINTIAWHEIATVGPGSTCVIVKVCDTTCLGGSSLPDCELTFSEGTYAARRVTAIANQCAGSGTVDSSDGAIEVYYGAQGRSVLIARDCALPSTITLTSADISTGPSLESCIDDDEAWSYLPAPSLCGYTTGVTGDVSNMEVYQEMTEDWIITLS
jgi:hypothetical protein